MQYARAQRGEFTALALRPAIPHPVCIIAPLTWPSLLTHAANLVIA